MDKVELSCFTRKPFSKSFSRPLSICARAEGLSKPGRSSINETCKPVGFEAVYRFGEFDCGREGYPGFPRRHGPGTGIAANFRYPPGTYCGHGENRPHSRNLSPCPNGKKLRYHTDCHDSRYA